MVLRKQQTCEVFAKAVSYCINTVGQHSQAGLVLADASYQWLAVTRCRKVCRPVVLAAVIREYLYIAAAAVWCCISCVSLLLQAHSASGSCFVESTEL